MHSVLRPNYRRARALALEIEAARVHLDEARGDPSYTLDDIEDLKADEWACPLLAPSYPE